MARFGDKLKSERENRGVGLAEIADATKINARFLEALEKGNFEQLPSEVFAKGFIRAYAQHIGADANHLIEEYEREIAGRRGDEGSEDDREMIREMSRILTGSGEDPASARRRTVAWIAGGLLLVVVAIWLSVRRGPSDPGSLPTQPEPTIASTQQREDVAPALAEPPPVIVETRPEESPPSAPEPEPTAPPEPSVPTRVTIPDYGVGTGVVNRRLVGNDVQFPEGQQVWFWNRVLGARSGETIHHVWIHEGREVGSVELPLGGAHWRTQSRKTLRAGSAGAWAVEARDSAGRVLARREFLCLPPE